MIYYLYYVFQGCSNQFISGGSEIFYYLWCTLYLGSSTVDLDGVVSGEIAPSWFTLCEISCIIHKLHELVVITTKY